ncbi:MAG TPA: hypothetical protein VK858_13520 [Longimicrobiales bacterium]|nr:hypothetical protein [Longimicrobiales bacterium]
MYTSPRTRCTPHPHRSVWLVAVAALAACGTDDRPTGPADPDAGFGLVSDRAQLALASARTDARADVDGEHGVVQMRLRAELGSVPDLAGQDVIATWEQAGGIEPQPFVVAMPAGCFARNERGYRVRDFEACGVRATLGGEAVPLLEFDAAMGIEPQPFTPVLRIRAAMGIEPQPFAAAPLLGTLAGSDFELAVGASRAGLPTQGIESVSGISPNPFLMGARTRALAETTDSGDAFVRAGFQAGFAEMPALAGQDVVVTWEQAGGISPNPFRVSIPAGCFVATDGGFLVRDFEGCGVRASLGGEAVPLAGFRAVMGIDPTPFAPFSLRIQAVMGIDPTPFSPSGVVGTLGGAVLEVSIGAHRGLAPPLGIGAVSGVEPQPF